MQCGELEAALRQQQEAYASLEGQLASSRQKVKELQVRLPSLHQCLSLPPGTCLVKATARPGQEELLQPTSNGAVPCPHHLKRLVGGGLPET